MINEKKNNNIKKILLAAGQSKRFGDKNKLSAMINGKPIILSLIHISEPTRPY